MKTKISSYFNIEQHGDDFYKINYLNNSLLVIACDGVSESTSGKIASRLITKKIEEFIKNNFVKFEQTPLDITLLLLEHLKNEFQSFYRFIRLYNQKEYKKSLRQSDYIENTTIEKLSNYYIDLFDIPKHQFSTMLKKFSSNSIFSSTINFLLLNKTQYNDYWKMLSFCLGDGYLLQTRVDKGNWIFRDLSVYRTTDDNTNQFNSKTYMYGDFELKESYFKKGDIITVGSDGTKIKNLVYDKPEFQNEPFREFSAFLKDNIKNFKNTSEMWFSHVVKNNGLDDDFTLISILLGDYLSLSKDFESD